jgi:hypothetical protein
VEQALSADQGAWDAYSKYRGQHLEDAAAELVAAHLPSCTSHLAWSTSSPLPTSRPSPLSTPSSSKVTVSSSSTTLRSSSKQGGGPPRAVPDRRLPAASRGPAPHRHRRRGPKRAHAPADP